MTKSKKSFSWKVIPTFVALLVVGAIFPGLTPAYDGPGPSTFTWGFASLLFVPGLIATVYSFSAGGKTDKVCSIACALGILCFAYGFTSAGLKRTSAWNHTQATRRSCGNQMVALTFACRLWADDNGGKMPAGLLELKGEGVSVKMLFCPLLPRKDDWIPEILTENDLDYILLTPGTSISDTNTPILRCKQHRYVSFLDGTYYDGRQRRREG